MEDKDIFARFTTGFTVQQYEYIRRRACVNNIFMADVVRELVDKELEQRENRLRRVMRSLFVKIFRNADNRK